MQPMNVLPKNISDKHAFICILNLFFDYLCCNYKHNQKHPEMHQRLILYDEELFRPKISFLNQKFKDLLFSNHCNIDLAYIFLMHLFFIYSVCYNTYLQAFLSFQCRLRNIICDSPCLSELFLFILLNMFVRFGVGLVFFIKNYIF